MDARDKKIFDKFDKRVEQLRGDIEYLRGLIKKAEEELQTATGFWRRIRLKSDIKSYIRVIRRLEELITEVIRKEYHTRLNLFSDFK